MSHGRDSRQYLGVTEAGEAVRVSVSLLCIYRINITNSPQQAAYHYCYYHASNCLLLAPLVLSIVIAERNMELLR